MHPQKFNNLKNKPYNNCTVGVLFQLFIQESVFFLLQEGERVRIAYEKKCAQLRNQDIKGSDPSSLDKTRAAIRDLQTQIKVSLHSAEAISKRIETLRDEELQPQLQEMVQGYVSHLQTNIV